MTEIEKILLSILAFTISGLIAVLSKLIMSFVLTKIKRSWYMLTAAIFLGCVIPLIIKGYYNVINLYYTFNEHLFINLLPLVIVVGLLPNLYLFFVLKNDYVDGDRLMYWSDIDFAFLKKKDWNVKVHQNIKDAGCLQLSKNELFPTVIFSVSANKRYHEVAFFKLLADRYAIRLHAMDLNVFKEQESIPADERFINYKARYDAYNLKDTLHDFKINKLNIILIVKVVFGTLLSKRIQYRSCRPIMIVWRMVAMSSLMLRIQNTLKEK